MAMPAAERLPLDEIKKRLTVIYQLYKPENLLKIDALLQKYVGQEHFLYETVCTKYNVDQRAFGVVQAAAPQPVAPALPSPLGTASELAGLPPQAWPLSKVPPARSPLPLSALGHEVPAAPWSKNVPAQRSIPLSQHEPPAKQHPPFPGHAPNFKAPALLPLKAPPPAAQPALQTQTRMDVVGAPGIAAAPSVKGLPQQAPPTLAPPTLVPEPPTLTSQSQQGAAAGDVEMQATAAGDVDKEEQEAFFALVRAASGNGMEADDAPEVRSPQSNEDAIDASLLQKGLVAPEVMKAATPSQQLQQHKLLVPESATQQETGSQPPAATPPGTSEEGDEAAAMDADVDKEDAMSLEDDGGIPDARLQEALMAAVQADAPPGINEVDMVVEITAADIVDIDTVLLGENSGFFKTLQRGLAGVGQMQSESGSSDDSDEESESSSNAASDAAMEVEKKVAPGQSPSLAAAATEEPAAQSSKVQAGADSTKVEPAAADVPNGTAVIPISVRNSENDEYGCDPSSSEGESDSDSGESGSSAPQAPQASSSLLEQVQRWRAVAGHHIFMGLDAGHSGRLKNAEMRRFATFSGFDGGEEDFDEEYQQLCEDQQCDPKEGITEVAFLRLINDESDRGCFCNIAELRSICESVAPAALQTMGLPPQGAV